MSSTVYASKIALEEKLKNLDFIKDFHIEIVKFGDVNRNGTVSNIKLKIRVWIKLPVYTIHILSDGDKIEKIIKDVNNKGSLYSLDIYKD